MTETQVAEALKKLAVSDRPLKAADIGVTPTVLHSYERRGLVKRVGREMSGKRGRPANLYWATARGRKSFARP